MRFVLPMALHKGELRIKLLLRKGMKAKKSRSYREEFSKFCTIVSYYEEEIRKKSSKITINWPNLTQQKNSTPVIV